MPKTKVKTSTTSEEKPPLRPALTPAGRESQLISLAMDLVEARLRNGTATSQEVTHFLKLGCLQHQLEEEKLKKEILLLDAKKANLESQEKEAEKFEEAIKAFGLYSGQQSEEDETIVVQEGD